MKRLTHLVLLAAVLIALVLLGVADTTVSIADTNTPDNEVASSVCQADDSHPATATITITMRTAPLPGSMPRISGLAIS